ncbi:MAG TPA: putative zinc-binding metallopeptidase [Steroidobacteraceae bacterium]|nr:putative zinc-binding metallopeptidase [Steroidobacteraceae bacterium]
MRAAPRSAARRRRPRREPAWTRLDDEALLDKRFCDLRLTLSGSKLEPSIRRLYTELERKGIRFRPHFWLSEEWFSPDGIPGIAIPFYLAHPRLQRLERRFMHEVEGGNDKWLMRILRHETGHAIDTAYALRRRKAWRQVFGKASRKYPSRYSPRPGSRGYVLHLGHWYAQSHPTEDFAETFAVWLPPRSRWRSQYRGWPAEAKLAFVDATMRAIAGRRAVRLSRETIEPLNDNRRTLREHYRRKRQRYEVDEAVSYDRRLLRVFGRATDYPRGRAAGGFMREVSPQIRRLLTRRARMHPYLVNHVLRTATQRARRLNLVLRGNQRDAKRRVISMLERIMMETLMRDRENYAL